jgi:23S rRNA (adenine1618-N6)-methyltransferase
LSVASPGRHPRNRHRGHYDFPRLVAACPALAQHLRRNPAGEPTVDFADPAAVRLLNRAILADWYGLAAWDLPAGYLCPPIPGRADYIHHLADLLAAERPGPLRALDIGTGASLIYAILARKEYRWSVVATDVDAGALAAAEAIRAGDPDLAAGIEVRRQRDPERIFEGVVHPGERFDLCLCNPPFHASGAEALEGSRRKWRNLGRDGSPRPVLNFGGQPRELWCPGGEAGFVGRMVAESARHPDLCLWFTSLVARSASLPRLQAALRQAGAARVRVIPMGQGQKESRVLAWSFRLPEPSAPEP